MSDVNDSVVAVLAGRRIDAPDTPLARFPLEKVPTVQAAISGVLITKEVQILVCSAACGADLLALEAAITMQIRCHVILPFEPSKFKRTSVADRPGDWGAKFDHVLSEVSKCGDLVVLDCRVDDDRAYSVTNRRIIDEGQRLANGSTPLSIVVWEGQPKTQFDATNEFLTMARAAGFRECTISSC